MGETLAPMTYALAMTVAIELPLAIVLFGVRGWRGLLIVALAQVATNPIVELVCLASCWRADLSLLSWPWAALMAVEVAAVVAEALFYRAASITSHPWRMSCVLNAISLVVGLILA